MERKELLKTATLLGLEFPKNIKSDKLISMVKSKIDSMNISKVEDTKKVYCGKNPITGEKVYK